MPYLRYSRDKRGYEHTYVLHGSRSGGRPRVLYWFRTPPNVAVGRDALDDDAIRVIEASNPELAFDWAKMRRERPKPPPRPTGVRARPPKARRTGDRAGDPTERRRAEESSPAPDASPPPVSPETSPDTALEATESTDSTLPDARPAAPAEHPVSALLGDAALARLRSRYAELERTLAERDVASSLGDELAERVNALNPDTWRAGEEVVRRIEQFDAEVLAVSAALGRG